jgi:hypothetical protein
MGTAGSLAYQLFLLEPGMKKTSLAWLEAMEKLFPGTTKKEGIEKLRLEINKLGKTSDFEEGF